MYVMELGAMKKSPLPLAPIVAQVSYQNVPRQKNENKRHLPQERQAEENSFDRGKTRELFEEFLEHNILSCPR